MEGNGAIRIFVSDHFKQVFIDFEDSGKGIPKNKHKTIFKPGYTTKRRGWGLGLSLAKRIIEIYHQGKIFVLHTEPGKGTVIRVILHKSA
jgi:signal transduction histidine kinase